MTKVAMNKSVSLYSVNNNLLSKKKVEMVLTDMSAYLDLVQRAVNHYEKRNPFSRRLSPSAVAGIPNTPSVAGEVLRSGLPLLTLTPGKA